MTDPYTPPAARVDDVGKTGGNTEDVRKGQKLILYAILINIAVFFLVNVNPLLGLINLVSLGMSIWGLVLLGRGMESSLLMKVVCVICLFIPFVNFITLLVLNSKATKILRDAGYKVGLMGASPKS